MFILLEAEDGFRSCPVPETGAWADMGTDVIPQ